MESDQLENFVMSANCSQRRGAHGQRVLPIALRAREQNKVGILVRGKMPPRPPSWPACRSSRCATCAKQLAS